MEFASTPHLDKDEAESRGDSETDEGQYMAHRAAAAGNVTLLMDAVNQDPSVLECQDEKGMTPLSHAVVNQRLDMLKLLVKMGADLNTADALGRTPLCLAAYECWYKGVVFLLRSGAKQLIPDRNGRLPLHAATCDKDSKTLSALLQNLSVSDINEADNDGMSALHWAAFHDRPEHVQLLMLRGGDIYKTDVDEKTPMHWASQNGSVVCCSIMAKCHSGGAPLINATEGTGKNCVHLACASGNAAILEVFASIPEVDFEALDPDERVPLHWAAVKGNTDCVVYLVQLGVDLSPEDVCGRTPLGYAKQARMTEIFRFLKESGAQFGQSELLAIEKQNSSGKLRKDQKENSASCSESEPNKESKKGSKFRFLTGWLDRRRSKSKENGENDDGVDPGEGGCQDLFQDGAGVEESRELAPVGGAIALQTLTVPVPRVIDKSSSLSEQHSPEGKSPASGGHSPLVVRLDSMSPRSEGGLSLHSEGGRSPRTLREWGTETSLEPSPRAGQFLDNVSPRSTSSHLSEVSNNSGKFVAENEMSLTVPNARHHHVNGEHAGGDHHHLYYNSSPRFTDQRTRGGAEDEANPAFPRYNPLPDPFSLSRQESNLQVNSDVPTMNPAKPVWSSEGPDYEVLEQQAREILEAQKKAEEEEAITKLQLPEGDFWNRFPYNNTSNPKLEPIPGRSNNKPFGSITDSLSSLRSDDTIKSSDIIDRNTTIKPEKGKANKKRRKHKQREISASRTSTASPVDVGR